MRVSDRHNNKAGIATEALTEVVLLSLFNIIEKLFHSVTPKRNLWNNVKSSCNLNSPNTNVCCLS